MMKKAQLSVERRWSPNTENNFKTSTHRETTLKYGSPLVVGSANTALLLMLASLLLVL